MYKIIIFIVFFWANLISERLAAQLKPDSLPANAKIEQCIAYAQKHNPLLEQSAIDEQIIAQTIRSKLADWYPQVNFNYNLQHNFQVQTSIIGGNPVALGVYNTSIGQFTLSQSIFNRDVLLALKSRGDVKFQSQQDTPVCHYQIFLLYQHIR